jgi:prepilin-type N-terminal cleavage/methylation domain-containing protein
MSRNIVSAKQMRVAVRRTRTRTFGAAGRLRGASPAGFTLVEVVIALVVVSLSLLALLRLHLVSIGMAEAAEAAWQAALLANAKIEEKLALGYPNVGTDSGTVENNSLCLHWKTTITDVRSPQFADAGLAGLREILVDVNWKQGFGRKHVQMSAYVANRKLQ